jgi:hypothetical protein
MMGDIRVGTFRVDVTPPVGSPLCAGMVAPVKSVADPLFAIGFVLVLDDGPVLLCAVDWCEIDNEAHLVWQEGLARALDIAPQRAALHTVHQHNAPIVDLEAQRIVSAAGGMSALMDTEHFRRCVSATAEAARDAARRTRPVTGISVGSATAREVASARRILGADGKVKLTRWSSAKEQELRDAPEGTIDPLLRTVTFLAPEPIVSLHFYATHPMSYYGDGVVTADFAGLAREQIRRETPGCEHIYFNGCGGDITAGKHNDGTPQSRVRLTARMHDALGQSLKNARPRVISNVRWNSADMTLPVRRDLVGDELLALVENGKVSESDRRSAALRLAYIRRLSSPTFCSRLRLADDVSLLFLPGEPFIEYQLSVAAGREGICVAGYGDTGPGYIGLARSYQEGGYEISASSVSEGAEPILRESLRRLLSA